MPSKPIFDALEESNASLGHRLFGERLTAGRLAEIYRRLGDWQTIDLDPKALNAEAAYALLPEWRGTIALLVSDAVRKRVEGGALFGVGLVVGALIVVLLR